MPYPLRIRETPNNEWPDHIQIGDTFQQVHQLIDGSEVSHWYLVLPNGALWNIYGKMSDGSKGWDITGDIPKITARPSILSHANGVHGEYHGWLTDGVLSNDLEGRTYP